MVKKYFVLLIASLVISFTSLPAQSLEPKGWSMLYALGNNLKPFGSLRIGYEQWEFGKLNTWAYGAAKNFYFAESYYTSLGLALMPSQQGTTSGLVASAGANWDLFWGLSLRLEIAANVNANSNLYQQGILGLGYDF